MTRSLWLAGGTGLMVLLMVLTVPAHRVTAAPELVHWRADGQVWHFSMGATFCATGTCDSWVNPFYDDMAATRTSVTAWNDIRQASQWRDRMRSMVDRAHDRGLRLFGSISNIMFWQEYQHTRMPDELRGAAILDPFGNPRRDDRGWFRGDPTWYSSLHPAWERYLLSNLQTYVDSGADGILVDEGAYEGELPDFRPELLRQFTTYLASSRSASELDELARTLGFASFAEFDYAKVWRDRLPPGTTRLTDQMWYDRARLNIPLHVEYYAFLRQRTREVMQRLFATIKNYSRMRYSRELPVAFNLNSIEKHAVPFLDLIDFVEAEYSYSTTNDWGAAPSYFPSARTLATAKLLRGLGLPAKFATNLKAREEIASRGLANTGLYRTLIADAFAGGQSFYVEERGHNIRTDFAAIAPWYRFVPDHPELFRDVQPMFTNVAVLQLWEQYEWHPKRALNGASAMLADDGWQFDVLFSGQDVYPEFFGVNRLLPLEKLSKFAAVIVPQLTYCSSCRLGMTPSHAQLLLDYVSGGGRLIVFADDAAVDNLLGRETDPTVRSLYQRLRSAPMEGQGQHVIRIPESWPIEYYGSQSAERREALSNLLEESSVHHVHLDGARRAVSALATRKGGQLIVQLVNYDYNRATDRTRPVTDLSLRIKGAVVSGAAAYTPDGPASGVVLPLRNIDGGIAVTVPKVEPWTVVAFRMLEIR